MTLQEFIASRMEPSEPQETILKVLAEHDGKRLTKKHIEAVAKAINDPSIRIIKQYGMTQIEWGCWTQTDGKEGGRLLVAYSVTNVVIDVEDIKDKNPAYFVAREARNAKRQAAIESPKCDELAKALEELKAAKKALQAAQENVGQYFGFGDMFYVDLSAILKEFTGDDE